MNDPTGPDYDKGQSPKLEEDRMRIDLRYHFIFADPNLYSLIKPKKHSENLQPFKPYGVYRRCPESEQVSNKSKASRLHKVFRLKLLAIVQALIALTERK